MPVKCEHGAAAGQCAVCDFGVGVGLGLTAEERQAANLRALIRTLSAPLDARLYCGRCKARLVCRACAGYHRVCACGASEATGACPDCDLGLVEVRDARGFLAFGGSTRRRALP